MGTKYRVVILGASYGSLLAAKLLLAGHDVKLVCLPEEAELIEREGIRVRMPVRGREGLVELDSRGMPGTLSADAPAAVDPTEFDLVALGMQEPQYRFAEVRDLLAQVARAGIPALSIMNMPPLPYLARIPGVDADGCRHCYTDPSVWDEFDPGKLTLCSPDPQAFRPADEPTNVLQVRLATNFKAAKFASDEHTQIIRDLAADIDGSRYATPEGDLELPVKLKIHDSILAPLAKWAMLMAGNYRCVLPDGVQSIREAVHGDLDATRDVYGWVVDVCKALGASDTDVVPFEKYATAAESLESPSSVARALAGGVPHVERVDCLVKTVAGQQGMHHEAIDEIVGLVDAGLAANRQAAV